MASSWGSSWLSSWGNSWGTSSAPVEDNGWLGGGKDYPKKQESYSYATPYQKMQAAKKEVVEVKAAIDHAALERAAIEAKLLQQDKLKAAQQKKLERQLLALEAESLRLQETLLTLMALVRQWDEEDALLVLAMSMPFSKIF